MAYPNFFNENINRTFPFRTGTAGIDTPADGPFAMSQLPDNLIADCGFILGPESEFVEGRDYIFLHRIHRVSLTRVTFEFRCNSLLLAVLPLIFTRESSDSTYRTEFVESAGLSLALSCGASVWSGYLVTGPISDVFARLAIGAEIVRPTDTVGLVQQVALVEPALLQNLSGSQVTALNLANADRTRALRPTNCPPNSWAVSGLPVVTVTDAVGASGTITYFAINSFSIGNTVSVLDLDIATGASLNITGMTIATVSPTQFTVSNATVGVSAGTGTAISGGSQFATRRCLTGALQLRSGYNVSISQNAVSNTLQFSAILGAGKGIPCAEVPLFVGEQPPTGASAGLLGGDFYCNEVLRSINGLQGPNLTLSAGAGVRVQPDAATHSIVVDIDLVTLSLCSPAST